MHWTQIPIHFIDFEGNGTCGILEFGVATVVNGEISATRTRICRARGPIDVSDVRLHGIRSVDTEIHRPFSDEWGYFKDLRGTGPLGAHHATFENRLLKMVWPYPPYSPDFHRTGEQVADWGLWIDTCVLYGKLFPKFESHSLEHLIGSFLLQDRLDTLAQSHCPKRRAKYHCALYDALASALLLMHLSILPGFEEISIEWLLTHSSPRGGRSAQLELFD